jgi:hypothetical protein
MEHIMNLLNMLRNMKEISYVLFYNFNGNHGYLKEHRLIKIG